MTTLEKVRAKVIKAVPEINLGGYHDHELRNLRQRPITLADVLRAIKESGDVALAIQHMGVFMEVEGDNWVSAGASWNLSKPLDEQEPEVLDFLGKILGVLAGCGECVGSCKGHSQVKLQP